MDINTIMQTIFEKLPGEMWLVAAAVWGVCFAFKKAAFFPDRYIPFAAVILGIILNIAAAAAFSRAAIVEAVINGVICGIAAVYIANIVKQLKKKEGDAQDGTDGI